MPIDRRKLLASMAGLAVAVTGRPAQAGLVTLRIGHLNNLTHAHALVARALNDAGRPFLEPYLGDGVTIEWSHYSSGTAIAESIFARALDLAFAGPNPVLNGYIRSRGTEMRLLAGALRGGAALVVPAQSTLAIPADFRGKKIGTPGLGNTQDVAARNWLTSGGLRITQTGGDALVLPTNNADQLALFKAGHLDAVWTVEPWVTRLVQDGGGRVLVEQPDSITTVLVATARCIGEQQDLARRFALAHNALTAWIVANPEEAQALTVRKLSELSGRAVKASLIEEAWRRLRFDTAIDHHAMAQLVDDAVRIGFIRQPIDLKQLYVQATA